MFGILRKKLKKAVEAVSKKIERKKEIEKEVEEKIEKAIEEPERIEKIVEEVPELEVKKEEVGQAIKEVKEEVKELKKEKKKPRKSLIKRVTERFVKKIVEKKLTESEMEPVLDDLATDLIEADVAYIVTEKIKNDLRSSLIGKEIKRGKEKKAIVDALRSSLLNILSVPKIDLEEIVKKTKSENRPTVLLFFGMNGVGKSLSLSKVAYWLKNKGYRPILGAGDTYRAAGIHQLEEYGKMIEVSVVKQDYGSDSCAVIFDTIARAKARGYDVVLGDTAGRMHTDKNLLDELAKIVRVNKPDLKILVLDSLSGSDVLHQFEFFDKAVNGIDAVIFSKVDVNEKGGNILSICYSFRKPIMFLGIGQRSEDLVQYDAEKFVNNLLS